MATTKLTAITTTATVTDWGLAVHPDRLSELGLEPGARVAICIADTPVAGAQNVAETSRVERLIQELPGMYSSQGGGMAEELMQERREDERRRQAKEW